MSRLKVAVAATVGALLALASVPAVAMAEDEAAVTWSVRPANADGPDGRSWIEITLDPGEAKVEHLALTNLSETAVTFAIKAADGYLTPTGRFNMLPSDTPSVDAGLWIEGPAAVLVGAGETEVIAFTINVPENATPGDHAAGIAATVQSVGSSGDGTRVAIESRVGFPVMTRVTGELQPSMSIEPVRADYQLSWNPFRPGAVTAVFELVNDGNVRLQTTPVVEIRGSVGATDPETPALELLPGERRRVTVTVGDVWPLVFAPVEIAAEPTVVALDGEPRPADRVTRDTGVWTLPLPQLIVLVGAGLIVLAIVIGRRRSKLRLEAIVAEAREAGRREGFS